MLLWPPSKATSGLYKCIKHIVFLLMKVLTVTDKAYLLNVEVADNDSVLYHFISFRKRTKKPSAK